MLLLKGKQDYKGKKNKKKTTRKNKEVGQEFKNCAKGLRRLWRT